MNDDRLFKGAEVIWNDIFGISSNDTEIV